MKIDIPHIFTQEFKHLRKVEIFRRVLYILLLVNALSLLPIAYDLYAYNGLIGSRGWNTAIPTTEQGTYALINVLSHPANSKYEWVYLVFVFGQIIFLTLGILKIWPKISSVLVFFFTINLFLKGYMAFTGGEVLVNIMLFYLMFIHKPKDKGWFSDLQNILNNSFYWIMLVQVCILYFYSAIYKFMDPNWVNGYAVMYVSRIKVFSSLMTDIFNDNYVLSVIATYLTLAYQLLFPIAVWMKRVKVPFLLFGVLFHLMIAFGMGIFTFGMIMIVMYILFLDESQLDYLIRKVQRKKATESVLPQ